MLLQDQNIWLGGYELTTEMNSVGIQPTRDALEKTVFTNQTHVFEPGLKSVTAEAGGFYKADPYDKALFDALGIENTPFSVVNHDQQGAVAYSFLAMEADYTPIKDSVGQLISWSAGAVATGSLVRGKLLHKGTVTADGSGTAFQLGAVPSDKKLYAILHVTRKAGTTPTLGMTIRSDNANNMGSPVTRITFSQVTDIGAQWMELAGPVTDDWFQLTLDVGGTSPQFDIAVILAIQ